jgi:hypothetical protein
MTSEREIGLSLLKRLLAGERANLPMHLALLLEKSSPLHNDDEHYRKILPVELAGVRLSSDTVKEISASLCAEIARNPDSAFIAALSATGSERVTKMAVSLLIDPPRSLSIAELSEALGIVNRFLPVSLARDRKFLSAEKVERLLQNMKDVRGYAITVDQNATQLLKSLTS